MLRCVKSLFLIRDIAWRKMSEPDDNYEFMSGVSNASSSYVQIDETDDVLASLELLKLITPLLEERPLFWKWTIIAAHSALQGAMVCALNDTTGTSVLTHKSAEKMLDFLQQRDHSAGDYPNEWLADFKLLVEKCSDFLQLTPAQGRDIDRLHELRKQFTHFVPKGWSIERAGLPRIVGTALDLVEHLMKQSRAALDLSEDDQQRLTNTIDRTRTSLGLSVRRPPVAQRQP
jgi:hypothetical protein